MSSKDFSLMPSVRFSRSKFDMPHGVKTSMSVGRLTPISIMEVLPGDNVSCKMTAVARVSSSFLKPIMDNLWMDVYHFFVPLRLVYEDAEAVFGKASKSMYEDDELEVIPTFEEAVTISEKTVGDYLGLPTGIIPAGLSVLPFRAFARIYNEWFRNENVTDEVYVQQGEIKSTEVPNNNAWSQNNYCGKLPYVNKKKDYFTSCFPKTQKGQSVNVPLGSTASVLPDGDFKFKVADGTAHLVNPSSISAGTDVVIPTNFEYTGGAVSPDEVYRYGSGLKVDLSSATASNVNDLRFAFQLQKMLERDALYGSRYNEYLLGHYGVSNPDARLQITEYLGGGRIPINIQQVAQTSAGTETSPLANLGAYSLSNGRSHFSKAFTEHGYIITVAAIRTMHTYQQGVPKLWSRANRNHFYDPLFANLGEQPVYKSELYANIGDTLRDNTKVFGFNEAWAEYRYIPSTITGEMRSSATNSFDIWHLADKYANAPTLTDTFIKESPDNVDRTLSVPSSSVDNFLCDFYFNTKSIRVLPTYSIPGLIDHH